MRIAVLSRHAALYSTSRLVRSGRAAGHHVDVIDPLDLQVFVGKGRPQICFRGHRLRRYDVLIPRIATSITRYGLAIVRAFEVRPRLVVLNGSHGIALSRDKLRSLALLSTAGLRVPRTVALHAAIGLEEALALVGGCPAVVKLHHGTQGVGTMLVESRAALAALAETMWAMGHEILLQEFVREAKGRDLRAFVIGGKVVATMERRANPGEFRSNLHRGGHARKVELPAAYVRCARRAARAMELEVAGVDLLRTKAGPVVLEVNSSPGLEGIELATGIDVATAILEHGRGLREAAKEARR